MKKQFVLSIIIIFIFLAVTASAFTVSDGSDISYMAASESMILLKNENNALPLTSTDKIAIFGAGQVFTDGRTGGFIFMGQGSGSFRYDEVISNPCDVLASYADEGKLGGVYSSLSDAYKAVAVAGVIGRNASPVSTMQYTISNSYTVSLASIAINLDANYTVTNCATVSEKDIITEATALTYGEDGFVYIDGKLSPAKICGVPMQSDVNGDGEVTVFDVLGVLSAMINHKGTTNLFIADINGDKKLTLIDVIVHIKKIA